MFCVHCGSETDVNHKFCSSCGKESDKSTSEPIVDNTGKSIKAETPKIEEKMYFEGEGEIVIKKVEHRGGGRKVASWLVGRWPNRISRIWT